MFLSVFVFLMFLSPCSLVFSCSYFADTCDVHTERYPHNFLEVSAGLAGLGVRGTVPLDIVIGVAGPLPEVLLASLRRAGVVGQWPLCSGSSGPRAGVVLSLIHISEPTRPY